MARKTKISVVQLDGRDKGKHFLITEMPASQAEKWAARAIFALGRSGVEVPPDMMGAGMGLIAVFGIQAIAQLRYEDAEPLMDEMFGCIQVLPDSKKPEIVRPLIEDDIEEVATRAWLRSEVIELHTGFSIADAIWASLNETTDQDRARQTSGDTSTSQPPSGRLFRRG